MPTTRDEEFKFTDLSDLVKASLCAPAEAAVFSGEQKVIDQL